MFQVPVRLTIFSGATARRVAAWVLSTAIIFCWTIWIGSFFVGGYAHCDLSCFNGQNLSPWECFFVNGQICIQTFPGRVARLSRSAEIGNCCDRDYLLDLASPSSTYRQEVLFALVGWTEDGGVNRRFAGFINIDASRVPGIGLWVLRVPAWAVAVIPTFLTILRGYFWLRPRRRCLSKSAATC